MDETMEPSVSVETAAESRGKTRRWLLRKAPLAAAAAIGASALIENKALATDGGAIVAGTTTTAEHETQVKYDGAAGFGGVVLLGNDSTYSGAASYPAALGGWAGAGGTAGAGGVTNGIYGYTDNGGGNAVVAVNSNFVAGSGAGVLASANSATGAGVKASNSVGTAVSGSSGSTAVGATAILGVISSAAPGGFSSAVRGQNNGLGGFGIGVYGSQAGTGWGMYATSAGGIGLVATGGAGLGAELSGTRAPVNLSPAGTPGEPTAGAHGLGDIVADSRGMLFLCVVGGTPGVFAPVQTGGLGKALFTAAVTTQKSLSNSNGVTWVDMDAVNLALTITPAFDCQAVISGNADLFTGNAGFNQDIGISVSGGAYPSTTGQPEVWKESGGFAGVFSPNAAYIETVLPLAAATTYTVKLQWKTNKPGSGTSIFAGAGPIAGKFSATRLTARLIV